MAILYPTIEEVRRLRTKPEEGELYLLSFLQNNLDDSFEVFFNPFLNGDRPDIIIIRKNFGVFIVEVKDWQLAHYYLDDKKKWRLLKNNALLKSPIDQVLQYKENMYNLHIENLLHQKLKDYRYWAIVNCGVYFHNETESSIKNMLIAPYQNNQKYQDFLKHNIQLLGRDQLTKQRFEEVLRQKRLIADRPSFLFTESIYSHLCRFLKPAWHTKEEGMSIGYSDAQKQLIKSEARVQRVKGVVGSGKTTVIAGRAVNAHMRTNERVLILTYNVTLRNYIHDKINKVRADFDWNQFYITNYHSFITTELNNLGIQIEVPPGFSEMNEEEKSKYFEETYYSNYELFSEHKHSIKTYASVLIDEIQDYKRPWMDILKDFFLAGEGEYVLFGDEKQNIYDNEQVNKDVQTNVIGRPSVLKDCFRSEKRIKNIAVNFQKAAFADKYELDEFNNSNTQTELKFEEPSHLDFTAIEPDAEVDSLFEIIRAKTILLNEHPNDITILGFRISVLRELEAYYRYKTSEHTSTMFETQEVWYKILLDSFHSNEMIKNGIQIFGMQRTDDEKKIKLAQVLVLQKLKEKYHEQLFNLKFDELLTTQQVDPGLFKTWYDNVEIQEFLKAPKGNQFFSKIKEVRDNKKLHFWQNSGKIKFSTIHSFKGWEVKTLIMILEPFFDSGDFKCAFEELVYTCITRARQNLIVINYGNETHADLLEELIINESY
ncbi:MAG: AAA family ATPase [Chitinophagaceae bacterium]|nr:AAA family ATPase [Chitinophagaceae bacterium]